MLDCREDDPAARLKLGGRSHHISQERQDVHIDVHFVRGGRPVVIQSPQ